jgi:DNA-binding IclR family transcriptional regulator
MSSIKRSVQVMELLARKSPLGVRAVATQLKLPLGSVHRLLLDLGEEGIAERTPSGEWELSFRLLEITGLQLDRIEVPRLAHPFVERIAQTTGETVNVYAVSGLACVCVDKVRGNEGMQLDMRIGTRGAINAGGAGKAVLAYMSEIDQERVLAEPLVQMTASTIIDPDLLRTELLRVRQRGYSIDDQEVVVGVYCVSVPILDRLGRPAGALSITGPSIKRPGPEVEPLVVMLNEACGYVSKRLGYAGHWPPVEARLLKAAG